MLKKILFKNYTETSFMIFSMSFGAGNVIFPLMTGYLEKENIWLSLIGFLLASVFLPILGFLSTMKFQGKYLNFLTNYSHPAIAHFLTLTSMLLLGPLGCIPRCVDLACTTMLTVLPWPHAEKIFIISFLLFATFLAKEKSNLVKILGRYLGPTTIASLIIFIILGLWNGLGNGFSVDSISIKSIKTGFLNGQFTFDLLAMIFYSQVIYKITKNMFLKKYPEIQENEEILKDKIFKYLIISSLMSGFIFTFIYGGMILTANLHASILSSNLLGNQLFSEYSKNIFGTKLGFFQNIFIVSSCFSTTIALLSVFSDYMESIFCNKISYKLCLLFSMLISLIFTFSGFLKIMETMLFLIKISYPFLILIVLYSSFKFIYNLKKESMLLNN